ncbi:MAG TPA: ATP-binding protein [Anaeromyxobacteraceae bacterium]|nr:ATP-binding protein [Anaeromyxobacteraceae bacterium]
MVAFAAVLLVAPEESHMIALDGAFAVVVAVSFILTRRGAIGFASALLVGSLWAAAALNVQGQGLGSPSVATFLLVLTLAGILLGGRGVAVAAAVTVGYLGWLYARQAGGTLAVAEASLAYRWFVGSVLVILLGAILAWSARGYARTRRQLAESEQRYRELVQGLPDGVVSLGADGYVEALNAEAERIIGVREAEVAGRHFLALGLTPPEEIEAVERTFAQLLAGEEIPFVSTAVLRKSGERRRLEVRIRHARRADGTAGVAAVIRDVEDRRRAEEREAALGEQLREARRLEAIGRLAGGVAHDFNNALTVIIANAQALVREDVAPETWREDCREILDAARHAAQLTRQLLAFGRRQVLQVKPIDLGRVVQDLEPLLRRLVGEDVVLEIASAPAPTVVRADPTQIEQVVINLVANARDAMPEGGRLTIETGPVELGADYAAAHAEVVPGPHALLAVSDTGPGFDAETGARIFEPFFSTKAKGTGLGLATVHGVVKQSGGHIFAYSEPGRGATFKVYLPRLRDAEAAVEPEREPAAPRRAATVLVVEDDADVMRVIVRMLARIGHRALPAATADEARRICREHEGTIDLLLSDVVMPDASGPRLARELQAMRPGLRVLYGSGYTENAIVHHGVLDEGVHFLSKPFGVEELAAKIDRVLAPP